MGYKMGTLIRNELKTSIWPISRLQDFVQVFFGITAGFSLDSDCFIFLYGYLGQIGEMVKDEECL